MTKAVLIHEFHEPCFKFFFGKIGFSTIESVVRIRGRTSLAPTSCHFFAVLISDKSPQGEIFAVQLVMGHFSSSALQDLLDLVEELFFNDGLKLSYVHFSELIYQAIIEFASYHLIEVLLAQGFPILKKQSSSSHNLPSVFQGVSVLRDQFKGFFYVNCHRAFYYGCLSVHSCVLISYRSHPYVPSFPYCFNHPACTSLGSHIIIKLREVRNHIFHQFSRWSIIERFACGPDFNLVFISKHYTDIAVIVRVP